MIGRLGGGMPRGHRQPYHIGERARIVIGHPAQQAVLGEPGEAEAYRELPGNPVIPYAQKGGAAGVNELHIVSDQEDPSCPSPSVTSSS